MAPVIRGNSLYTTVIGDWQESRAASQALGGDLTIINDDSENEFIYNLVKSNFTGTDGAWVGFSYNHDSRQYEWVDGTQLTFNKWAPGEPNRTGDFGHIWADHSYIPADAGYWDDIGSNVGHGIAEIPFIQRGDSIYVIVRGPTWEEAEANAQALGGHLVTINDAEENEFLKQFALSYSTSSVDGTWIGLADRTSENNFLWADGSSSTYRNWTTSQPDDFLGQDYVLLYGNGKWDDAESPFRQGLERISGIAEIRLSDLGTIPTLQSATASSNKLILTFSEDIKIAGSGVVNPAYLTVTGDGQTRKISGSQSTGSQLVLTLSGRSLNSASSVSVSYNPPNTSTSNQGFITNLQGTALAAIKSQAVDTLGITASTTRSGISLAYKNLLLLGTASINGYGNALNNTITGNDGNNILDGLGGSDSMSGGKGDDTYIVDTNGDTTTELASEGTDTVQSSVSWTLAEHLENLLLTGTTGINGTGNSGNNIITGNNYDNILNGMGGTDTLIGGRGNDTYIIDSAGDIITEFGSSSDIDSVQSSVSWILGINLENLILTGSSAINGTGNNRDNIIIGNSSNNVLDGGNGGTDRLTGLEGGDTFKFTFRPTSFRNTTADHITDFSSTQGDKIQISKSAFGIGTSAATLSIVNSASAVATALTGSAQFIYETSSGELHWNQNGLTKGAGSGGILAILDNKASLSAGDLVLI